MAEPLAAALEARRLAARGPRDEAPVRGEVLETASRGKDRVHLERVRLPVGGEPQHAPRGEPARGEGGERGLQQAALVVALLGPGIGEEDENLVERSGRDLRGQHLDCVVTDDTHVRQPLALEARAGAARRPGGAPRCRGSRAPGVRRRAPADCRRCQSRSRTRRRRGGRRGRRHPAGPGAKATP